MRLKKIVSIGVKFCFNFNEWKLWSIKNIQFLNVLNFEYTYLRFLKTKYLNIEWKFFFYLFKLNLFVNNVNISDRCTKKILSFHICKQVKICFIPKKDSWNNSCHIFLCRQEKRNKNVFKLLFFFIWKFVRIVYKFKSCYKKLSWRIYCFTASYQ